MKGVAGGWLRLWVLALWALPVAGLAQTAVDPDLVESIRWYVGATGRVDDARAKELLEKAAADADPLSTMWTARVYSTGRMGFKADAGRAKEIAAGVIGDVEVLAGQGSIEAQFLMGTAFAEGLGKPRDDVAAVSWYRRAAEAGHLLAQHNLGNVYDSGTGVQRDPVQAVAWWRRAADQGDAIPQFQLGRSYERGIGVNKDIREALAWYRNSAARGYARAIEAVERMEGAQRR